MKHLFLLLSLCSFAHASEVGCWPLLKAEADKYSQENVVTTLGTPINYNGSWGLWGSVSYADDTYNTAKHLYQAIEGSQFLDLSGSNNPVAKILKSFSEEIQDDCYFPSDEHKKLQGILQTLMNEGDFCPNNKMLERGSFFVWSKYRKVLSHAVKSGRFQEECQSVAIQDDLGRDEESVPVPALDSVEDRSAVEQ
jgi:hypothetical protein